MAKLNIEMSVRITAEPLYDFCRSMLTLFDTDGRHDSQSREVIRERRKAKIDLSGPVW